MDGGVCEGGGECIEHGGRGVNESGMSARAVYKARAGARIAELGQIRCSLLTARISLNQEANNGPATPTTDLPHSHPPSRRLPRVRSMVRLAFPGIDVPIGIPPRQSSLARRPLRLPQLYKVRSV